MPENNSPTNEILTQNLFKCDNLPTSKKSGTFDARKDNDGNIFAEFST
jgi:hypothetical protein